MSADDTLTLEAPVQIPESGASVAGYVLGEVLGRGAHGVVYRARKADEGREYALKLVGLQGHPRSFVERIQRECAITTRLHHPGIVGVHEVGSTGSGLFIVMDLATGRSGDHYTEGILGWEMAAAVVRQVALALAYAFSTAQVIHRDIKPANIVIDIDDRGLRSVKVVDFGLSRSIGDDGGGLTMTGAILGTPYYMSPEQAQGVKDLGFQTDLYALGATLFTFIAGRAPFHAGTPIEILLQHCQTPAPRLDAVHPGCPKGLADVVARCLAKQPAERFPSYAAFITALDGAIATDPFAEPPPPRPRGKVVTPAMIASGQVHRQVPDEPASGSTSAAGSDALGALFRTKIAETTRTFRRRGVAESRPDAGPRFAVPGREEPPARATLPTVIALPPVPPPPIPPPPSGSHTAVVTRTQGRPTSSYRRSPPSGTISVPVRIDDAGMPAVADPEPAPARTPSLAPGTRIDGVFEILGPIGAGAMGEVYAVEDRFAGRTLALKILSEEDMARPGAVRRFRCEATALATVDHPAFPYFAGKGIHAGRDYLMMERVAGVDLKAWLQEQGGRVAEPVALGLILQLVQAMQRAHAKCGMVHRDIKPANLMVTDRTTLDLKIIDFGVSTYINYGDFEDFSQQEYTYIDDGSAGRSVGTPAYMSPEQCTGAAPSPGMDIYAIGCLFHQLITGRTPFVAGSTGAMLMKHLREPPPTFDPALGVSSGSGHLLARCLAKKPQDRFREYATFELAIRGALHQVQSRQRREETTRIQRGAGRVKP